ncbi:hypothetical protein SAMN02745157_0675 [Kaistia soli DSM 19436]|uniref:HD domain-containing protein n=1 Tax=Kaistia soli DSM 19436 TaxID=1122133 RepID=A0A1M4VD81_9HYPH|nr:hypothetical protein [Kaistia soli]SHE66954.1 hypothetical protein SAMN02745157_0675 [Kaistia soli DSM 19436]
MTWIQTRSGKVLDLYEPKPEMIDIERDVAPALALINRFNGHAGWYKPGDGSDPVNGYSVAQHSILGARALLAEWNEPGVALAFLLHDSHEFAMGDFTTPVVAALDRLAWPRDSGAVSNALRAMKGRLDAAIYARLGLAYPIDIRLSGIVRDMDLRMLRRERDELMSAPPQRWHRTVENADPIPALGWRDFLPMHPDNATRIWLAHLAEWLPLANRAGAR